MDSCRSGGQLAAIVAIDSTDYILTEINHLVTMSVIDRCRYAKERIMTEILDPITQRFVDQAAKALAAEFAGIFSEETIARYIADSLDRLGESRINVFVPVLAHRFARERLRALGQVEGLIVKEQPEVLFVCVHNSGRSQMAAGLVKLRSEGRIHVRSAGSQPGERINPAVIEAMRELGVDMSEEFPKPLTDEVVQAADVVITMGCGDACPIYPGKKYADWVLDDPAGQDLDTVRRIRDELGEKVLVLIEELLPTGS
jgi:protein-tyrosine-phosphatase